MAIVQAAEQIVFTAEFDSPIGKLRLASTDAGLAWLGLPRAGGRGFAGWLARNAPRARREAAFAPNRDAIRQLLEYLDGKRTAFELALDLRGTGFQRAVWDALLRIPYGETRSYGELARAIGKPSAVRAVGLANGANPVALVVPCHRVIGAHGGLTGYGGGLELKRRLLAMEQSVWHQGSLL
jgi:methylated-DNA-[protein]-cysteine S-methyltransferase